MACWECAMCAIYGFAVGMVDAFLKKCNAENTVAHTRTRSMATDLSLSPFALQSLRECQQLFKFQELRLELSMNMKPICHTKHNESDDEEFWLSSPTIKHIYSWVAKRSLTLPTNTWSMHWVYRFVSYWLYFSSLCHHACQCWKRMLTSNYHTITHVGLLLFAWECFLNCVCDSTQAWVQPFNRIEAGSGSHALATVCLSDCICRRLCLCVHVCQCKCVSPYSTIKITTVESSTPAVRTVND